MQGRSDDQTVVKAVTGVGLQVQRGIKQLGAGGHSVQGLHGGIDELFALLIAKALRKFAGGDVGELLNHLVAGTALMTGQGLLHQLQGALFLERLAGQQGVHEDVGVQKIGRASCRERV